MKKNAKKSEKGQKDKKEKKDKTIHAYYLELESPLDLARQAFGLGAASIKAIKDAQKYRLLLTGEHIGEIRIIYYATVEKIGNFFVYHAGWSEQYERSEIKDSIISDQSDYKSYKAPIVELLSLPYKEEKSFEKAGKILLIEAKDWKTMVKAVAGSAQEDSLPKLYAFYKGSDHIIGTFDFFKEGVKVFTYAKTSIKEKFGALSYSYPTDTITPVNAFAEKSETYIRVINLKKPFPFF